MAHRLCAIPPAEKAYLNDTKFVPAETEPLYLRLTQHARGPRFSKTWSIGNSRLSVSMACCSRASLIAIKHAKGCLVLPRTSLSTLLNLVNPCSLFCIILKMSMTRDQLEHLTETDVRNPIPADVLLPALNSPPFVPSTSLINIRNLGVVPGSSIRPGLVYRCGTLEATANDPKALDWLAAHVKHIFDIRSPMERKKAPDPEVKGVVNTWLDSTVVDPKPNLDDFVEGGGEAGVRKEYLKILDIYRPSFRAILEHVRDKPGEAFLFHCTGLLWRFVTRLFTF